MTPARSVVASIKGMVYEVEVAQLEVARALSMLFVGWELSSGDLSEVGVHRGGSLEYDDSSNCLC